MGTTKLTVEFVISGVIMSLALMLLVGSIFPGLDNVLIFIDSYSSWLSANWALLAVIFTSVAYGFGVIGEYLGLITFEWLLDTVKERRMQGYITSSPIVLEKSPLLIKYKTSNNVQMTRKEISGFYGDMRFYVMMRNSQLYAEISSYINRFLLIRVLFLAEVIVLISLIVQLFRNFSSPKVALLFFITFIAWANFHAVKYQFEYYCRAVERSYKALLTDTPKNYSHNEVQEKHSEYDE